jgi:hypothetical protein
MSGKKNGKYKTIKAYKMNLSSFTKKNLKKGKKYFFRVKTYKLYNGKKYFSKYSEGKGRRA